MKIFIKSLICGIAWTAIMITMDKFGVEHKAVYAVAGTFLGVVWAFILNE